MTNMPLVSIVVPVYNAQSTVGWCINSLLNQTLREVEIILVDDGSTDDSLAVCRRYAQLDARVRVLSQPNGGVSSARNAGMQAAKGEYLLFVDSDDTAGPELCARLAGALQQHGADVAICGHEVVRRQGNWLHRRQTSEVPAEYAGQVLGKAGFLRALPPLFVGGNLLEAPFCKLYRRSMLRQRPVQFAPGIAYGEDLLFNLQAYALAQKAVFVPYNGYQYVEGAGETLSSRYVPELIGKKLQLCTAMEEMLAKEGALGEEARRYLLRYKAAGFLNGLMMLFHPECPLSDAQRQAYVEPYVRGGEMARAFEAATGQDAAYARLLPLLKKEDTAGLLAHARQIARPATGGQRGFANRAVVKVLRLIGGGQGTKLARLADDIEAVGIKNTLKRN